MLDSREVIRVFLNFGDFEDEMNLPEYLVPHLDEQMLSSIGFEMWPPHLKDVVKRPSHAPKQKGQGRPPAIKDMIKRKRKKKKKKATPTKNEGSIADDKDLTEGGNRKNFL